MVRTLVTGASGTLGSILLERLANAGHEVRATSRDPASAASDRSGDPGDAAGVDAADDDVGVEWVALDLADGTGVEAAVRDVDVVVHAASNAVGDSEAVDARGTERLVAAANDAGVDHLVYPSIVGIDDVPYSYYEHKLAAEAAIEASSVPSTIVRATQFHQFLEHILRGYRWLPVWPVPTRFRSQPVDARVVADQLVASATSDPAGRADPICGPEVLTGREIASQYRAAKGYRRPIVRLPFPGAAASAVRDGHLTSPADATDTATWREYLGGTDGERTARASATATSP